jgi:hypothetical protein
MENKKPFWETKIGKIIGGAKEILPNNGVLGVLKNLIDSDDTLSAEEKKEAHSHLKDLYEIEVADRDSARDREARIKEAGQKDPMMMITGLVGLAAFLFVVYAVVYMPAMTDNDLFIHLMGMIEGVVVGNIFAYYYGTSSKK